MEEAQSDEEPLPEGLEDLGDFSVPSLTPLSPNAELPELDEWDLEDIESGAAVEAAAPAKRPVETTEEEMHSAPLEDVLRMKNQELHDLQAHSTHTVHAPTPRVLAVTAALRAQS